MGYREEDEGKMFQYTFCLSKNNWMFLQMLTVSIERFQAIQREAPVEFQQYLVHVTKYQDAGDCKVDYVTIYRCTNEN